MKKSMGKLALCCALSILTGIYASAAVLYVNPNSSSPASPFGTWDSAAHDIQSAVNVANPGDEVLVTNGIYNTGQSYLSGSNRVTVLNPILLQSVNGPAVTVIQGHQVPVTTNGPGSMRCVYLGAGATLSGFTLTNGTVQGAGYGGGIYCQATNSLVFNCVITGNFISSSSLGGGGAGGAYADCQIIGNAANEGYGGGIYKGTLTNCLVAGNQATYGAGLYYPLMVVNCTVVNNAAVLGGGGVEAGSGIYAGKFFNSIIYFNHASPGYGTNVEFIPSSAMLVSNCCSPDFTNSTCITNLPGMVDVVHGNYRLQVGSPCIDAGNNAFIQDSLDLDGNPRIFNGTVDMGAYENEFTGTAHFVSLASTNPVSPFTNWLSAATNIQNAIDAAGPGDWVVVSNGIYQTGGTLIYGSITNRVAVDQPITVASLNGPASTVIAGLFGGPNGMRCVYLTNGACLMGFTLSNGWASVATSPLTNGAGGGVWCESTNALMVDCNLVADHATYGAGAYSGTFSNCWFSGCLGNYGGGAFSSILENCVVSNNNAIFSGGGVSGGVVVGSTLVLNTTDFYGGGTASNIVLNSLFLTNSSETSGGGAFRSFLTNCTLIGNYATNGGASFSNFADNCVFYSNSASNGGAMYYGSAVGCLMASNNAVHGGVSEYANLTNCTLTGSGGVIGAANGGICYGCTIMYNSIGVSSNTAYGCLISSNTAGGAYNCILYNCTITYNNYLSPNLPGYGADGGYLNNCLIEFNYGFGAVESRLNNCTVIHNFCGSEHGIDTCLATNCIIYYNFGQLGVANYYNSFFPNPYMINCCTTPAYGGPGDITNAPVFLDNFHEASNSPTIGAGYVPAVSTATDFDGRPRTVNGAVDMGASEFQGANVEPFIVWLAQYDLPDDGSADYVDSDGTGMNNWQKWIAGLNPTNPASVLAMNSVSNSVAGATVTWQSVTGITYYVQSSTNLMSAPAFTSIQSNIVGQVGTTSYTDPTATNGGNYFYRVGVQY